MPRRVSGPPKCRRRPSCTQPCSPALPASDNRLSQGSRGRLGSFGRAAPNLYRINQHEHRENDCQRCRDRVFHRSNMRRSAVIFHPSLQPQSPGLCRGGTALSKRFETTHTASSRRDDSFRIAKRDASASECRFRRGAGSRNNPQLGGCGLNSAKEVVRQRAQRFLRWPGGQSCSKRPA